MSSIDLPPIERANFASISRFISCLVTESLVAAYYTPLKRAEASGFATILNRESSRESVAVDDILVVVPLHHPPVLKCGESGVLGEAIGLLDPLDMLPLAFEFMKENANVKTSPLLHAVIDTLESRNQIQISQGSIHKCTEAVNLWLKYASNFKLDDTIAQDIAGEFASAVKWAKFSYEHPPDAPHFSSPSIVWEQSIVEGHPTHPMHKIRRFLPPLPDYNPGEYNFLSPKLRFVSVPRENLKITGDFNSFVAPLVEAASLAAEKSMPAPPDHIVVPAHDIQIAHIQDKFPDALIYPPEFSLALLAQQSLRSVILADTPYPGLHLKLPIGVRLTSAVRTISPESAFFGPRFSSTVVPALTMNREIVTVARELASVVHTNPNGEIAKHCAALVRECHEDGSEDRGERLIVCTALVERGHAGPGGAEWAIIRAFDLDTQGKRVQWLQQFIDIFLRAFLPPMLHNGVGFECHPQNCVARFDIQTKELKGFIIRDFGGLKVHMPTLEATTGVVMEVVPGHSVVADSIDAVYRRMYHTVIHNHFQQLIRVLGLHYNGLGWEIVREQLGRHIPEEHPLRKAWLDEDVKTVEGKCFLRMRMASMYRFHHHGPFPNLIHYTGCERPSDDISGTST